MPPLSSPCSDQAASSEYSSPDLLPSCETCHDNMVGHREFTITIFFFFKTSENFSARNQEPFSWDHCYSVWDLIGFYCWKWRAPKRSCFQMVFEKGDLNCDHMIGPCRPRPATNQSIVRSLSPISQAEKDGVSGSKTAPCLPPGGTYANYVDPHFLVMYRSPHLCLAIHQYTYFQLFFRRCAWLQLRKERHRLCVWTLRPDLRQSKGLWRRINHIDALSP